MNEQSDFKKTPLHDLHIQLDGKIVPFAGYHMPVQFPLGIIKEHLHTRAKAGLFDVFHMGQIIVSGSGVAEELEKLIPIDVLGELAPGVKELIFLQGCHSEILGVRCYVTRSGYTGEDGFEISLSGNAAPELARYLLSFEQVEMKSGVKRKVAPCHRSENPFRATTLLSWLSSGARRDKAL